MCHVYIQTTRPEIYDPSITGDKKPAAVCKKEVTWENRVSDYEVYAKPKLKARAFILNAVENTWVLKIKD